MVSITDMTKTKVFRPPSATRPIPTLVDEILEELESFYIDVAVARKIAVELEGNLAAAKCSLDAGDLESAKTALRRARAHLKEIIITLRMVQASQQRILSPSTVRNVQSAKNILEDTLEDLVKALP